MRDSGHTEVKASIRNSMTASAADRWRWLPSGSWPSCTARWKTDPPMAPACADAMLSPPALLSRAARPTKRFSASALSN
jgi:hypothetical protein